MEKDNSKQGPFEAGLYRIDDPKTDPPVFFDEEGTLILSSRLVKQTFPDRQKFTRIIQIGESDSFRIIFEPIAEAEKGCFVVEYHNDGTASFLDLDYAKTKNLNSLSKQYD